MPHIDAWHMNESCRIWISHFTIQRSHGASIIESRYTWESHITNKCVTSFHHTNKAWCTYAWVTLHMKESYHIWISHVTYEWVMSHMNESCLIQVRYFTIQLSLGAHMNKSRYTWESHFTYKCVTSHMNRSRHIWMNHVVYESVISPYKEVMVHLSLSHVTHERVASQINVSRHTWIGHVTYEWIMSYIDASFLLCDMTHESCRISMSHVAKEWVMAHRNESCDIGMSHIKCVIFANKWGCTYTWFIWRGHINKKMSHITHE